MQAIPDISNVLLIDDDDDECFLFSEIIKEIDPRIRVHTSQEGEDVVAMIKKFKADLVFLDINLPKLSGYDCINMIRKNEGTSDIPIVMYSCSSQKKDINITMGLGANLYFIKPEKLSVLQGCLRHILALDWNDPSSITFRFFHNGEYSPLVLE